MTPQDKLKKIREELKQQFLERADLIDGALAALLSSHHLLIIGPPGTAKSMLADELCRRIEGANYFQWLLTRFTTPEEIFGAVSLKALEQDDYRRVTNRKLPEAHIAFLDEIFKANSSILECDPDADQRAAVSQRQGDRPGAAADALRRQQRAARRGRADRALRPLSRALRGWTTSPRIFAFCACSNRRRQPSEPRLTLAELTELQNQARAVAIPSHVYRGIADIRRELNKKNIQASDRRYRQSLALLQAHAYLDGEKEVYEKESVLSGACAVARPRRA